MITFRALDIEADAADLARIYSCTTREPIKAEDARDWWTLRKGEIRITMLAFDNGRPIGYWDVDREEWMHPGRYWTRVILLPEARGNGLGARMYAEALACARSKGAAELQSSVREDDPVSIGFAERRGFTITHHTFESTLDLAAFDERCFGELLVRVKDQGFRFFSLAEAGVTDENKRKLYEVNRASGLDNPGGEGIFSDFDTFSMNVFNASWFRPETQILVALGDEWVGLSAVSISEEDKHSYNAFTGVLRGYRGRGLATALKLQTILLAKSMGMLYIRTNNDSQNTPMLAVNRRLGYKPEPGLFRLLCRLNKENKI